MTGFSLLFLSNIGVTELILIFLVVLLIFGASNIPKIAKSLGEGIKEFKKATKNEADKEKSEESLKDEKNKD